MRRRSLDPDTQSPELSMAKAYTPGLLVTNHRRHRCRRILPIAGEVKVRVGDHVGADDVVAETSLPGDVNPVNLANQLSMPAADVMDCVCVKEGDSVGVGDTIAQTKGIFGLMKTSIASKVAGTVETISPVTGQMIAVDGGQHLIWQTPDVLDVVE